MVTPAARRLAVGWLQDGFGVSQRRSCKVLEAVRSTMQYRSRRGDDSALRAQLIELAAQRRRFGYRRLTVLLRRGGTLVNHKKVYRLYRQEQLTVRRRRRKKLAAGTRIILAPPTGPNQRWSMDFMGDSLATGRTFRILNIVDDYSREAIATEVDTSLPGLRVVRVLERIAETRRLPAMIVCDNGPEFTGRALDSWAYSRGVQLRTSSATCRSSLAYRASRAEGEAVRLSRANRSDKQLARPSRPRAHWDIRVMAATIHARHRTTWPSYSIGMSRRVLRGHSHCLSFLRNMQALASCSRVLSPFSK